MGVCPRCGLPQDLCVCEELDREQARIVVRLELRRFGRATTIIEGMDPKRADIHRIAQGLKRRLACGGTAKNGCIMLQGDHRGELKSLLVGLGFRDSSIEIQ